MHTKKRILGLCIAAGALAIVVAFLAGIGFTGVTGGYTNKNSSSIAFEGDMAMAPSFAAPSNSYGDYVAGAGTSSDYESANESFTDLSSYGDTEQKWVVTVDMSVETRQYSDFMSALDRDMREHGAYAEYTDEYDRGGYHAYRQADVRVRVPVENLDAFLATIGEGANVTSKSKDMENITLQYSDTEAYKRSLEIEQEQLIELLGMATTVDEIIQVRDRLTSVQYDLERVGTRLRTYDDKVAFATVRLRVTEVVELSSQPMNFFERALEGIKQNLRDIREFVLEVLLWLVSHLPAILIVVAIVAVAVKLVRRRKVRKAKAKSDAVET